MFPKKRRIALTSPLMLKASSLFYAIIISLIIALISSSLILFAYFNKQQFQRYLEYERVIRNVDSGMTLLLGDNEAVALNAELELDLFGSNEDPVFLKRRNWGAFEVVVSQASFKGFEHKQVAMIGANLFRSSEVALYLADQNKPLSLCGRTLINGITYLPKSGVKRAYIEGQSFVGNRLIEGEVRESEKTLPAINLDMIKVNTAYLSGSFGKEDSVVDFSKAEDIEALHQSFSKPTVLYYSDGPIDLDNRSFHGNIIFVSGTSVYVSRGADIKDVIIYAPEIIVADGFSGNFQAFAGQTLEVGKNCRFNYPSVLGLISSGQGEEGKSLQFGKRSELSGVLFAYQAQGGGKKRLRLTIDKSALIEGQVYSSDLIELKGTIHGSLACQKFILRTPSSVYENHLLNAVIDPKKLSKHFVGVNLLASSSQEDPGSDNAPSKQIVKWLD